MKAVAVAYLPTWYTAIPSTAVIIYLNVGLSRLVMTLLWQHHHHQHTREEECPRAVMVVDRALPLQHREETGEEEGGVLLFLSSQASAMSRLAEVAVAVEEWEGAGMPLLY